jgi:membrane-associated phospholipid phosphatase
MSRWLYPFERRAVRTRLLRLGVPLAVVLLVLLLFDRAIFHWVYAGARAATPADAELVRQRFESFGWVAALRSAGYLGTWIVVAVALYVRPRGREARGPALESFLIVAAAALAGASAEILKPIVGRVRPLFTDGRTMFRSVKGDMAEGVDPHAVSYGMASSHAAVAFGAACMVLFLYGRPGWVALGVAAGCGLTRMIAGAHFASDVFVGAVLGYAWARLVRPGGWWGDQKGLLLP